MPLKPLLDSLDGLQDNIKSFHVRDGDKHRLDGFKTASEIDGLTSALSKERARAEEAEKTLKAIPESVRKGPSAAKKAMETVANLGDKDKDVEAKIRDAQEGLNKQIEALIKERDSERAARRNEAEAALSEMKDDELFIEA